MESIYGEHRPEMEAVKDRLLEEIACVREGLAQSGGMDPVEHVLARIKDEESMRQKCRRKGLPETTQSAICQIRDAIGIRVVCAFIDDVYAIRDHLKGLSDCQVVEEKDYIRHAKPNGYRSYHMILRVRSPLQALQAGEGSDAVMEKAPAGQKDGSLSMPAMPAADAYYAEIQLRTISMDTWAALEHHLKYKKEQPANARLIESELKRCADELASTDVSMQTIRDLIMNQ